MHLPEETLVDLESRAQDRHGLWGRRVLMSALALFVALGLAGWWGVRSSTASSASDGWDLGVEYPSRARAGIDVPFRVTVTHPGGFGDGVVLTITGDFVDLFETQAFHPEPSDSTRDADLMRLSFAAPAGDTFVVTYDAYLQPSAQRGGSAEVSLLVDGEPVTSVPIEMTVLP